LHQSLQGVVDLVREIIRHGRRRRSSCLLQ
jgi:hypothetical protein